MKLLIDDIKLNLLLEQKKSFIGKKVAWDSILSAVSFLISVVFASYSNIWIIPGWIFKTIFLIIGCIFTAKAVIDVIKSKKNSYSYEDLLKDINTLNEITHDHSIVAVRDTFNKYPNRFLVYDDTAWGCELFINYRDNVNNGAHITDHFSREMKIDTSDLRIEYVSQLISEKISGRDNKNKVYRHNLFLMEIKNFPEYMKNDVFECNGIKYYWKSISELENDNNAMSKNSDIIRFVKDKI